MATTPITDDTVFVPAEHVCAEKIDDEAVLLNLKSGRYYTLNDVGTRIWDLAIARHRFADVVDCILEEYDIDEATCRTDALHVLAEMLDHRVLVAEL